MHSFGLQRQVRRKRCSIEESVRQHRKQLVLPSFILIFVFWEVVVFLVLIKNEQKKIGAPGERIHAF